MNNTRKEVESLTIRPACVTDLATILNLYKESLSLSEQPTAPDLISTDFGLPVNVFLAGKQIIGYSYMSLKHSNRPELGYRLSASAKAIKISDELLYQYPAEPGQSSKLADSVSRLIKWLNDCN